MEDKEKGKHGEERWEKRKEEEENPQAKKSYTPPPHTHTLYLIIR